MKIEEVIRTVNQMKADGIITNYAIGGAVAATFYLEPISTLDVDIFVERHGRARLQMDSENGVRGRRRVDCIGRVVTRPSDREIASQYVLVSGWPVQFLPPIGPLIEEAMEKAVEIDIDGMPARVFTAEHLAAIALETGRAKDKARLLQFIEAGVLGSPDFEEIIERHGLGEKWERFAQQFLRDES
jgi:hypothetical protein